MKLSKLKNFRTVALFLLLVVCSSEGYPADKITKENQNDGNPSALNSDCMGNMDCGDPRSKCIICICMNHPEDQRCHGTKPSPCNEVNDKAPLLKGASAKATANDWTFTSDRVGPIRSTTTDEELISYFGKENVKFECHGIATGLGSQDLKVAIIFPGNREQELEVMLLHNWVTIKGRKWHSPGGISIGTQLEEIEKNNGKPFSVSGFEQDLAQIRSWNSGKFESEFPSKMLISDGHIGMVPSRLGAKIPQSLIYDIKKDTHFSSNNKKFKSLNPIVGRIDIQLKR